MPASEAGDYAVKEGRHEGETQLHRARVRGRHLSKLNHESPTGVNKPRGLEDDAADLLFLRPEDTE